MIKDKIFIRVPLLFQDKIKIYPPSVQQVVENDNFSLYLKILTFSQEEIADEIFGVERTAEQLTERIPTPFEWLFFGAKQSQEYKKAVEEAFNFFTQEKITFLFDQNKIVIGDLQSLIEGTKNLQDLLNNLFFISEENFFEFQNLIRAVCGLEQAEKPNPNEHIKITRMKAKARYRDKIKAKQKNATSFYTCMTAICCMGIGITPLNIGELSYAAVQELISRYQEKEKYEIDIKSLQAGASSKDVNPKYWIRNIN